MDRGELDKQTKETRSTKNIVYWIVGIGVVLALIALMLYTPGSNKVSNGGSTPGTVLSDTIAGDILEGSADTLATDIRED